MNHHLERLLSRVTKVQAGYDTECWDPGYARNNHGYCQIRCRPNPVSKMAHRFAYEQMVAPIPSGLVLDHLCCNRWCCNPWHVEPVTQAVNVFRGESWASKHRAQTHCKHGHEFTPENTYIGKLGRACRTCGRIRAKKKYYANKGGDQ